MKNLLLPLALIVLVIVNAEARIIRLNNQPGITANATTLQAAHDSAAVGDTIHVESSTLSYGDATFNKKVIVIGTGYFLGSNPETQANLANSKTGNIYFVSGSENSVVMGCEISGRIYIRTSSICVMRNKINGKFEIGFSTGGYNMANILIKQNYITWNSYYDGSLISLWNTPYITNLLIRNNILVQTYTGSNPALDLTNNCSGIFENNILINSSSVALNLYNFSLKNNIVSQGSVTLTNCQTYNNIANATQFGTINGNMENITISTLFAGSAAGSSDGYYKLAAGSVAIGAGESGTDIGAFGGSDPYVLSGMPNIPSIYYFSISGSGTQSQVKIKVKSHN